MKTDPGQRRNLANQEKEKVKKIKEEVRDSRTSFEF
jgi:hypothetical protein